MTEKKRRKPWEKEGRYQYILKQLRVLRKELASGLDDLNVKLRILLNSLASVMDMDKTYFLRLICHDEIDELIMEHLFQRGSQGTTPSEAVQIEGFIKYGIKDYQITRRLQRMNRKAKKEFGETVAYTLHRRWHISRYANKVFKGDIGDSS